MGGGKNNWNEKEEEEEEEINRILVVVLLGKPKKWKRREIFELQRHRKERKKSKKLCLLLLCLRPRQYAQFLRQESVHRNRKNSLSAFIWTMKATGKRTCIITLRFSDFESQVASGANKCVTEPICINYEIIVTK